MNFVVCAMDISAHRSEKELLIQVPRIVSTEHLLSIIWQLKNECPSQGEMPVQITVDLSDVDSPSSSLMVVLESFGADLRRQGHKFTIRG